MSKYLRNALLLPLLILAGCGKPDGSAALLKATSDGDVAAMRNLLKAGADPNRQVGRDTPLVVAATKGDPNLVSILLEAGAAVDGRDAIGTTPLFAATLNGNEEVVVVLLSKGARANAKMPNGVTAIEMAELKGYGNISKLLREARNK